jgi:hypothetical protein
LLKGGGETGAGKTVGDKMGLSDNQTGKTTDCFERLTIPGQAVSRQKECLAFQGVLFSFDFANSGEVQIRRNIRTFHPAARR